MPSLFASICITCAIKLDNSSIFSLETPSLIIKYLF